jgi:hypothetical protein
MNYVLYEMNHTKGLTTTPMCSHETNVSRESIKEHIIKSPMHHKLNQKNIVTVL